MTLDEPLGVTIGRQVKVLRKRRGWSAQRLCDEAKGLGFDLVRSTIANLESGARSDLRVGELVALSATLGVTAEDLTGLDRVPRHETTIARPEVLDLVRKLGHDPNGVTRIIIDSEAITVIDECVHPIEDPLRRDSNPKPSGSTATSYDVIADG